MLVGMGTDIVEVERVSVAFTTDLTRSRLNNNFIDGPNPKRFDSRSVLAAQYKDSRLTATASLLGTYITDKVEQGDTPADKKRLSPAVSLSWRPFAESTFRVRVRDIHRVLVRIRAGQYEPHTVRQWELGGKVGDAYDVYLAHDEHGRGRH